MTLDWTEPDPDPLTWLFPTSAEAMRSCARRLAFQGDHSTRSWVRGGTRAGLGIVAHRLTELVLDNQAPAQDRRLWLEARWAELLEEQREALSGDWPGSEVPETGSWPGVTATRVRLLRTLATMTVVQSPPKDSFPPAAKPTGSRGGYEVWHGGRPFPWVEQALFDPATRLAGKPDRVDKVDGRVRLLDLKAGVGQAMVSEPQERQLLIYAHLVRAQLGHLPDDVVIVDVKGHETPIDASPARVDRAVSEASDVWSEFSEMLEQRTFPGSPSVAACRWCPFRVVCVDYWTAREPDWPMIDVRGVVVEATNSSVTLKQLDESNVRVIGSYRYVPEVGEELVAVDLERAGSGAARLRWWSRVRHDDGHLSGSQDHSAAAQK